MGCKTSSSVGAGVGGMWQDSRCFMEGHQAGTNWDQYLALSHTDLKPPWCGLCSSCISLVTHLGFSSSLFT